MLCAGSDLREEGGLAGLHAAGAHERCERGEILSGRDADCQRIE